MNEVKIRRIDLIEVLKKNRSEHRAIFEKAMAGFKRRAIEVLEKKLETAKRGIDESVYVSLEVPTDQTKDYDRKIRMFEMDVRDELELSEQEFACYVMDDWQWKRQFTQTTAMYMSEQQ